MTRDIVIKASGRDAAAREVEDLLGGLGAVEARRMFSGHGVFLDGLMFALLARGCLYLKCDAVTRPAFEAEGSQPFTYLASRQGVRRRVALSYWRAPDAVLESRAAALHWGGLALAAARRAAGTDDPEPTARDARTGRGASAQPARSPSGAAARPSARRTRPGAVTRKK